MDVGRILRDGAGLAMAASIVIMGALRYNPRLFLRHFPAAVRQSQPPLSVAEMRVGRVVFLLLMALLVVVPIWSALASVGTHAYGLRATFGHAFLVGSAANLTDWLILDELWLGLGQPRWALPPGVSFADVPFDHRQHARGFLTGSILCACVGVIAAVAGRVW
jgi:hypothetical protein